MADEDLCFLSATEVLRRFKAKSLSPVELMRAIVDRCERVNPKLNAFTETFFERALKQAGKAEAKYMKTDGRTRRLEGVPLTVKDDHPVKGHVTTHGSRLYKDKVDDVTELAIDRLLKAGAIMHARTTTPEFASATICHTPLWGVTRNPWNRDHTPGGSSGGSAAAVASGMTTIGDGADYAGSVRVPAACCGVFGFKPPTGRVPSSGPWNLNNFSVFGPITRTVADGVLMQNVWSGPHRDDPTTVPGRLRLPDAFRPIEGLRIAVSTDLGYAHVDPDVRRNTLAAAEAFREAGCTVEEVDPGFGWDGLHAFVAHSRTFAGPPPEEGSEAWEQISDYIRERPAFRKRMNYPVLTYAESVAIRTQMWRKLLAVLRGHDLLLCPTNAVGAVAAEHSPIDENFTIDGKVTEPGLGWNLTWPFNMLPQTPAATVPSGFDRHGVPTGLQIVGRPYDDLTVFRAAAAFEHLRPWSKQRPEL